MPFQGDLFHLGQGHTETIRRFRTGYVAAFGAAAPDDLLYEAVSEGRRYPGMEHWLPLFPDTMETLFDYLPGTPLATPVPLFPKLDPGLADEELARLEQA